MLKQLLYKLEINFLLLTLSKWLATVFYKYNKVSNQHTVWNEDNINQILVLTQPLSYCFEKNIARVMQWNVSTFDCIKEHISEFNFSDIFDQSNDDVTYQHIL